MISRLQLLNGRGGSSFWRNETELPFLVESCRPGCTQSGSTVAHQYNRKDLMIVKFSVLLALTRSSNVQRGWLLCYRYISATGNVLPRLSLV